MLTRAAPGCWFFSWANGTWWIGIPATGGPPSTSPRTAGPATHPTNVTVRSQGGAVCPEYGALERFGNRLLARSATVTVPILHRAASLGGRRRVSTIHRTRAPLDSGGGRAAVPRGPEDGDALGTGRQALLGPDLGRSPPLPGLRDPPPAPRAGTTPRPRLTFCGPGRTQRAASSSSPRRLHHRRSTRQPTEAVTTARSDCRQRTPADRVTLDP